MEKLYTVIGKSLVLVSITLDKDDNPYLIFESLNAKGRPLTQADLIRNFFFMRIHVDRQADVFTKYWRPMQDDLGENLTEFIRHFLMRDGQIIRQSDVYYTLKETVENRPETTDDTHYLADMARFSKYYARLLNPEIEPIAELSGRLTRLNRIEATTTYPFLLNAYDDLVTGRLSEGDFVSILDLLETFLIRRFVCSIPTNALLKVFVALYGHASKTALLEGVKQFLKDKDFPRDRLFKERFISLRLYGGGDRLPKTRLILERLEQSFAHKEAIAFDQLSVEHVMPQTLTDTWKDELGGNWEVAHEMWLHTIGNLTLTGYNPELSNADFSTKRAILQKSHVELNRYFGSVTKWNEQAISQRADHLADVALKIWPDVVRADEEPDFEVPDEDSDEQEEDVRLLKANVLDQFGGAVERVGSRRYHTHKLKDGKIINIKYSRPHKSYYWFGVHASLWEDCLQAGVTHMVFILGQFGFASVPLAVMKDYIAEAGISPKSDGTPRHYHVLISREPKLEMFHYAKPVRYPLKQYTTTFVTGLEPLG